MRSTAMQRLRRSLAVLCTPAGRDCYETRIPDSIKVCLATTPSEQLDDEAVNNERLFYYRFAMDLPRPAREQFVSIKQRHGLTDAECRWLRRSGAPAWKQALGSIVLAAFWLSALWFINRMFLAPWRWLRAVGVAPR